MIQSKPNVNSSTLVHVCDYHFILVRSKYTMLRQWLLVTPKEDKQQKNVGTGNTITDAELFMDI